MMVRNNNKPNIYIRMRRHNQFKNDQN